MKSRKFNKVTFCRVICLLMVAITVFMTACGGDDSNGDSPTIKIQTSVAENSVLTKGQEVTFMIMVSDDSPYTVSVSNEALATIKNGNTMKVLSDVTVDTEIKLIVTINRLPDCKKEVKFLLKAPVVLPTVELQASKAENSRLELNDQVSFTPVVSDGSEAVLSVNNDTIAQIDGNVVKIIAQPAYETTLIVTATLKNYPTIKASKSYYVKAPVVTGQVNGNGNVLTTELIQALGNKNITVNGDVTDYFIAGDGSQETVEYKTTVKMNEGKWYGEWYAVPEGDNTPNVIADSYLKGNAGVKDANGVTGSEFKRVYINKNNERAEKVETDSMSHPYLWENNHLWNHLEEFAQNVEKKFQYDSENDVFSYLWKTYGSNGEEIIADPYDEYLMTYISYSFTPMMDDTFENFYFKMENGAITKLLAKTAEVTYGNSRSYTIVEFTFADIGSTEVPDPAPYAEDDRNEALKTAIDKMKAATSYTFKTEEVTTQAPSYDDSDYSMESTYSLSAYTATPIVTAASFPVSSATGTVGITGKIVKDNAVLITNTGKYEITASGENAYHMSYYGYKQVETDKYDEFSYNASTRRLEGTHQYSGSINSVLPGWDFNVNVFKFNGSSTDTNGKTVTKYILRDTAIIGDVAKEVCMHSNVNNTVASSQYPFEIAVDSDGNVVYSSFPYNYSSYSGYCKTTYANVDTFSFTDEFDGYAPRVLPEWDDITTDKYYYKHSNSMADYGCYDKTKDNPYHVGNCDHVATLDTIIENVFGIDSSLFPTMATFRQIFGDNIYTPYFFEYDEKELADGSKSYIDYVSFTAQAPKQYLDDKNNLSDAQFTVLLSVMKSAFENAGLGITYSEANSDYSGGAKGTSDRWVAFANETYIISINNNHTKYFWIEIHKVGEWTLSK